jgi:hypothetical protein
MASCLLQLQTIERMIGLTITFVLQKSNMTPKTLLEQAEKESKRTLGYFLKELQKRADVHPGFGSTLRRFLKQRNTFVHDLTDIPGSDLETEKGREIAARFLMELAQISNQVLFTFSALTRRWLKETKLNVKYDHPMLREIDEAFGGLVDDIFIAKKTEPIHPTTIPQGKGRRN